MKVLKRVLAVLLGLCAVFFAVPAIVTNSLSLGVTAAGAAGIAWMAWSS